jgi:NagD protein
MPAKSYLIDMDGVIVHGKRPIPGAAEFIEKLKAGGHKFLVLTNNSKYTPQDLAHRLEEAGLAVGPDNIFSSAMATAHFVSSQKAGGSAYVVGETGLFQALHEVQYHLTEYNPDVVILGEMESYPYEKLIAAMRHILRGVPFIATNPDVAGPSEAGMVPACGAVSALIEKASGYHPYFVGKPNPLIMRLALRHLNEHSENAVMVGDNMETDIKVGLESGMETILVLSGVTSRESISRYPYRPNHILESVADITP